MDVQKVVDFLRPYLPNVAAILIIIIAAIVVLKSLNKILWTLHRKANIPYSYYHTFRVLIRAFIYLSTLLLVLIFIPGVNEQVIALVGIGLGVLVSLSSTTTIGNAVAGAIIYLTRPVREGDRIEIDGVLGDVVSIELLFIHIKTIKDEIVSIPALQFLNHKLINYSELDDVIIHVSVTLGYDLDPGEVEELMLNAIKAVEDVKKEPKPFVLIRALNDYTVDYEVNGHIDNPQAMIRIASKIRRNIITEFTEKGVQIMSPSYVNINQYREKDKVIPQHVSQTPEPEAVEPQEKEEGVKKVAEAKHQLEKKKRQDIKLKD